MSQTLLTPTIITRETLRLLVNNMVMAALVNRQFENKFVKIGSSLTIRKPNRFTVSSGPALQIQQLTEPSVSIAINTQNHVDFQFTSQELTLTIEEFAERYLKPAAEALANQIDFNLCGLFNQVPSLVGTSGTIPSTFANSVQLTGQQLDIQGAPMDGRNLVLDPAGFWSVANGLSSLFVMPTAKEALVKGYISTIGNHAVYEDQNIQKFIAGTFTGTFAVGAASQTGSTLAITGTTNGDAFNVGDVFTIAGVNAVNPQNRQTTGSPQQFIVTSTATIAAGVATLSIYPAITPTGPYQNVTASPGAAAVITRFYSTAATKTQDLAFHKDAFGLITVPLEIPDGVDWAAREQYKGLSIRLIRAYDINNDVFPCRLDILYGYTTFYPELAVRLNGN